MLQKNTFGVEVLRDINKLKNGHYYRHRGVAFRFFRLLPVSGSAFPSRDQSTYSERSYCTQIWLEGYIMYPLHQSMFFAFLYHFFFSCFIKKRKIHIFSLEKNIIIHGTQKATSAFPKPPVPSFSRVDEKSNSQSCKLHHYRNRTIIIIITVHDVVFYSS